MNLNESEFLPESLEYLFPLARVLTFMHEMSYLLILINGTCAIFEYNEIKTIYKIGLIRDILLKAEL